jgi:PAS domain S-box-containing protein
MQDHAIIIANRDGVIQFWSEGAAKAFGFSPEQALGHKLDLVVPPDLRSHHWAGFGAAMSRGSANAEGTFFDIPGLSRTGEIKTLRGQLHVLRDEQKSAIGAMAIFTMRDSSGA